MTVHLSIVEPAFIDKAWADGASALSKACETSGGEITGDQLKMILARGERSLVAMVRDGKPVGWMTFRVEQLPNMRVLYISALTASGANCYPYWQQFEQMAQSLGCSRVRCAAKPAQARLYRQKLGFSPVYETLEKVIL